MQLQDIPGGIAPPSHHAEAPGSAADPPSVAADQHTINLSAASNNIRQSNSYDSYESAASWVQHLSWHPRLHLHHNLLTPEECDRMRELLARPSGTVGGASVVGRSAEEEEASLMLMIDVEQRVANWTALPPDHLEGWQVSSTLSGWLAGAAHTVCWVHTTLPPTQTAPA
jgi:hypothetical protein